MIHFFKNKANTHYAVQFSEDFSSETLEKLQWLFGEAQYLGTNTIEGNFIGPRAVMITPWSTNAVEITQNMGIEGIIRIEEFTPLAFGEGKGERNFDPMLLQKYTSLHQNLFTINVDSQPILEIDDISTYNQQEGLALSDDEIQYLENLSKKLGRKLTDSEVFGFSQVNSEHCRHKIFNGTFIIDGETQPLSLFKMIKKTSEENPNSIISAYKDNVAFLKGPEVVQFAPNSADKPDFYTEKPFNSVLSVKAETHNFPTTVEPFNGAATGSGGEIRDRLAGGKGSLPLAGTAVYMTAYSRTEKGRAWEENISQRQWLYQTPTDILIKASNGASDFGNKFGQPLITGSVLTFEHQEVIPLSEGEGKWERLLGYDKVIMLAGGVGYGKQAMAKKETPQKGDKIVVLGGENYRIGMGGAAVSSANTGAFGSGIELNAIQRSNPEMQKRAANAIRGLVESDDNPIVSIHDHGAGGHLNCLSELVEETGGLIHLNALPVGDPTLSAKEIIGNESQERIGLVISPENMDTLKRIAERERSPMYEVGEVTDDKRFVFLSEKTGEKPMDFALSEMFGSSPKTILKDETQSIQYDDLTYDVSSVESYLTQVLQLEAVGCKDWLTNKVDRCVGGRVAKQQCVGALQLPLNNVGVMALDFKGKEGIATSVGHSPLTALISAEAGSRNAIAEALTNIVFAPLQDGINSVSLSANWMWACNNKGQDARLYKAVKSASDFAIALGINIPTGKDSLSMKQKYPNGESVMAPGTVIISAAGHCSDIRKTIEPVLKKNKGSVYYIHFGSGDFALGGSSLGQVLNKIGKQSPDIIDANAFSRAFNTLQRAIGEGLIAAGHDVGSGGLITTLLEMCFAENNLSAELNLQPLSEKDSVKVLFNENAAVVVQAENDAEFEKLFATSKVKIFKLGKVISGESLIISNFEDHFYFNIAHYRDIWYRPSYLLDQKQTQGGMAHERYQNYKKQPLYYQFPSHFNGKLPERPAVRPKAAIIREKGSNSEREMAHALYLAGFDVKDVHMTDLISGRETLEEVQFIGAVGGFSNSDVLGSAKGWAGSFKYNEKARLALENFFKRNDTLSVGICNGCQLLMELELITPEHETHGKMKHNISQKHESGFTSVEILPNNSVMLSSLSGARLGIWISHGEGRFSLPMSEENYHIVAKYGYDAYPSCPNGSDFNTAMLCDKTGRHLVSMPHFERSIFQWNWANYPEGRYDEVSPWLEAFVNARKWIENQN